jgi:hypothetical protein
LSWAPKTILGLADFIGRTLRGPLSGFDGYDVLL